MKTQTKKISKTVARIFDKMLEDKRVRQNEIRRKIENGEIKVTE